MEYKERKLRHELKFPATMPQCEILRQRFSAVMTPDKNGDKGKYRITSLYLDDAYNSAYIDKQNGTDTRKKYRIRTYDLNPQKIRFECKYKDNSMTSKRSMWITLPQYESILKGDFSFAWDKQYAGTVIDDGAISNSISLLSPSVVVDYTREAYINKEGNVRFTIDSGFKVGAFSRDMFSDKIRYIPISSPAAVIELKYDEFLPSYLLELVGGVGLRQDSFSKFLICKEALTRLYMG